MTMTLTRALAAAALLFAGPAMGQTLEQSYADQCSGGNHNETCDALRKALMEKLSGQDQATGKTGAPPAATASKAPVVSHSEWGPMAGLVTEGAFYRPASSIVTFRWAKNGTSIVMTEYMLDERYMMTLLPDGVFELVSFKTPDRATRYAPIGDGLYAAKTGSPDYRFIMGIRNGVLVSQMEKLTDGVWAVPSIFAGGPYQVLDKAAFAALPGLVKKAKEPAAVAANWGDWSKLAGSTWVNKLAGFRSLRSYSWADYGLTMTTGMATLRGREILSKPETFGVIAALDPISGKLTGPTQVAPDGSLVNDMGTIRTILRWEGGGYVEISEEKKGTGWKRTIATHYKRAGPDDITQTVADLTARNGDGGLFSTLLGAAVGGVAAVAGGADAATAAGLMMRGAAVTSGNGQMAAAMANGSAEVAASNAQMEAQLEGSINRGLAQGNAQYRAEQGSNAGQQRASSSGIEVGTVEATPTLAMAATPAPAPAAPRTVYWRCMAAKGGTTTIYSSTFGVPSGSRWNVMTLRSAYDQFLRGRGSGFLRDVGCRSATTMAEAETLSSFNTTGQTTIETVAWSPQ